MEAPCSGVAIKAEVLTQDGCLNEEEEGDRGRRRPERGAITRSRDATAKKVGWTEWKRIMGHRKERKREQSERASSWHTWRTLEKKRGRKMSRGRHKGRTRKNRSSERRKNRRSRELCRSVGRSPIFRRRNFDYRAPQQHSASTNKVQYRLLN